VTERHLRALTYGSSLSVTTGDAIKLLPLCNHISYYHLGRGTRIQYGEKYTSIELKSQVSLLCACAMDVRFGGSDRTMCSELSSRVVIPW
jgi:hypothetical protein